MKGFWEMEEFEFGGKRRRALEEFEFVREQKESKLQLLQQDLELVKCIAFLVFGKKMSSFCIHKMDVGIGPTG